MLVKKKMAAQIKVLGEQKIRDYYQKIELEVQRQFEAAQMAREKGKDASLEVESKPTADLADRTEKIIGPPGIAKRFREVFAEQKEDRTKAIFQLFREIIEQKWCTIPDEEKRLEQAVKSSLVLVTEGVVVAPIDGVPQVKISKNHDGSRYVDIYFAGPIRAAGGTATVFPLILGDYARKLLDLDRYKPTEEETERYVEEVQLYDEIISRQYKLSADEVRKIIRGCPVCINGEPTEETEVTGFRDIERVATNRVRGGMCLVISEGIGLKAMKILTYAKLLSLDWNWLENIIKINKSGEKVESVEPNYKYLTKIAAGRPIFSYPSTRGGFRLRYGRARNTGIMGRGAHPATMHLLDDFIAVGTQLKVERPGKSSEIFPVDSIEGPIVRLSSGEVKKISSTNELDSCKTQIDKILFLGDMLVSVGDFRKTAHPLMPAGFCHEWWLLLAQKAAAEKNEPLERIIPDEKNIDGYDAVMLSEKLGVPLHPAFLHFYGFLLKDELKELLSKTKKAQVLTDGKKITRAMLENTPELKKTLEKILLPHRLEGENIIIEEKYAFCFLKTMGYFSSEEIKDELSALENLSNLSGLKIMDKAGTFIGARMGRPEAAKPRKMTGNPHCLFPIGIAGGNTRSINKAAQKGQIEVEIAINLCTKCRQVHTHPFCYDCSEKTQLVYYCQKCRTYISTPVCQKCGEESAAFDKKRISVDKKLELASKNLKVKIPELVKGVRGLINKRKVAEPLEKGILRATHNLHIFRDATIRYEMLNAPITHFKPQEIGVSVEKLKELGYAHDIDGKPLETESQLLELFPQDIIVNEEVMEFILRVTRFIDDELEKFYGLEKYYNKKTKEEIIGELVLGLAPHTSAGIVGRIIGHTKARVCFAHPYFHLNKRRNCLVGKTPILIQSGQNAKSIEIRELDKTSKQGEIPVENIFTYTINEQGFLKTQKVTALFKKKSPKRIYKIKTGFGREIELTGDHKLLTLQAGKIVTKKTSDLKGGEELLSLSSLKVHDQMKEINVLQWYSKNLPEKTKKKIRIHNVKGKLTPLIKKFGGCFKLSREIKYATGKSIHTAIYFDAVPLPLFEKILKKIKKTPIDFQEATISYNKQKSSTPISIPLNKEFGEVLGYFLADGWARTTKKKNSKKFVFQVNFVSKEKEITALLKNNIKKLFSRKVSTQKRNGLDILSLSGRVYYDLFVNILKTGKNAKDKRVPKEILNASKECIKGVIGGYAVGDGHISSNSIKVVSVNKLLINDFCLLLNRIGCFGHIFSEKRQINSGIVKEFYERKGKIAKIRSFGFRVYSTDLLEIGETLFGEKKKKFDKIKKTTKFFKKRVKKIGNFILDKIKNIKKIKSTSRFVYDLIVEGEKNFIGGFGNIALYDCDGDQDSIMLLMDALLNFSEHYLPSSRGGRMDAPLVFTIALNPLEIDDEAYDIETCTSYPLKLYENAQNFSPPYINEIERVQKKLGTEKQYTGINFTHSTEKFDAGPKASTYVTLQKMEEKITRQARLQKKISAVQLKDSLERVIVSHFLPDIIGNARSFSKQNFRCTNCNTKYRRIPLVGHCTNCEKGNIILTISHASITKYLGVAKNMCIEYELSNYLKQRLDLIDKEVKSIFAPQKTNQKSLFEFA